MSLQNMCTELLNRSKQLEENIFERSSSPLTSCNRSPLFGFYRFSQMCHCQKTVLNATHGYNYIANRGMWMRIRLLYAVYGNISFRKFADNFVICFCCSCNPLDSDQLTVATEHLQKHMLEHIHPLITAWVRHAEVSCSVTLLPCLVRFIRGQYSTVHVNKIFTERLVGFSLDKMISLGSLE